MGASFEAQLGSDDAALCGSEDEIREEVIRILEEMLGRMRHGRSDGALKDINGNTIGRWYLGIEPEENEEA